MKKVNDLLVDNIHIWTCSFQNNFKSGKGTKKPYNLIGIKKLRELILELAIEGKLVDQNVEETPADIYVEHLKKRKSELIEGKEIKKPRPLPLIDESEYLKTLPQGWTIEKLGNLFEIQRGSSPRPKGDPRYFADVKTNYHWIKISDITAYSQNNRLVNTDEYLTEEGTKHSRLVTPKDLIVAVSGSVGKASLLDIEGYIYDGLLTIKNIEQNECRQYLLLIFKVIEQELLSQATGSAWKNINTDLTNNLVLKIPPLAEQRRIVRKVSELMSLCDLLEKKTEDSINAHQQLVEELLSTLTKSQNAQDFEKNWARIAEHFDLLFTTEHSVEKLKQTILQLAVMGKLVPQNAEHIPASVLIQEVTEIKQNLIKEKVIKKQSFKTNFAEEKPSVPLPSNWEWSSIAELAEINPKNESEDDSLASFVPMPLISTSYKGEHGQELRAWHEIKKGYTHFSDGDLALAKITPCFENSKAAVFSNLENGVGAGTTELHVARFIDKRINPLYALLFIKTPLFLETGKRHMTGSAGQKRVPKDFFATYPMPLPPAQEQSLIVDKVDSLMSLCDQMKEVLNLASKTQVDLSEAIVAGALN